MGKTTGFGGALNTFHGTNAGSGIFEFLNRRKKASLGIRRLWELKAYGYVRSADKGPADAYETIRQTAILEEYACARSVELVEIFRDDMHVDTLQERQGLAKMMLAIERDGKGVDTILVEKMDRLSPSITLQEILIHDFKSKGCAVVSVRGNTEGRKDAFARELIRQTLREIRQYDKEIILLRSKIARQIIGEMLAQTHGGRADGDISSEIIAEMKKLRRVKKGARRMSYRRIADKMNENGHTHVNGEKFTAVDVAYYINRKEYPLSPQIQQLAPFMWKD